MKVVLIGGGEPGLRLLSWLSMDPSIQVPLVIEPDRRALIYRVETLGFHWSGSQGPPLILDSADAMAHMAPPDLVMASISDPDVLARVRSLLPATIPLLLPQDLAICRRLHQVLCAQTRPSSAPLDQDMDQRADKETELGEGFDQLESFVERFFGNASWPLLLERMTWWMQWLCGASQGALFVYRGWGRRLLLEQTRGLDVSEWQRSFYLGIAQQAVDRQQIMHWMNDEAAGRSKTGGETRGETIIAVPMTLDERPVGVIVLARPSVMNGNSGTTDGTAQGRSDLFALSWLAIRLAGLLCRGMQMEWTRESVLRDQIRRGIKDIIARELPAGTACQQGVELIAGQLSAASCRLFCRGPRASGWVACSSAPASRVAWASSDHPSRGTVMLTAASLEPLLFVQEPQMLLYLPFALGSQGDGVLAIEHPGAEMWSVQLVELLKEMGQLLGTVAQRAGEG
jgi:hypothetical protein